MCDQMAANGNIPEVQYEPDAALQFPLSCQVRQRYFQSHMVYSKTILHRVHTASNTTVIFRTTHAVSPSFSPGNYSQEPHKCEIAGQVRHYTMTAAAMRGNKEKMQLDGQIVNGKAVNYANASCSLPYGGKKHKLTCTDYSTLYWVQRNQVDRFEKHGSAVPTHWMCPGCSKVGNVTVCKQWSGCA